MRMRTNNNNNWFSSSSCCLLHRRRSSTNKKRILHHLLLPVLLLLLITTSSTAGFSSLVGRINAFSSSPAIQAAAIRSKPISIYSKISCTTPIIISVNHPSPLSFGRRSKIKWRVFSILKDYDENNDNDDVYYDVDEDDDDVDDEEECSIDNLDACLAEGKTEVECCIVVNNNLDNNNGSLVVAVPSDDSDTNSASSVDGNNDKTITSKTNNNNNNNNLSLDQSLKRFVSMPIIEVCLALLVLLSSFLVGLETLQSSLPTIITNCCKNGEIIISSIFTMEYFLRWKLSGYTIQHIIQPLAIIDLIAILPGVIKLVTMTGIMIEETTAITTSLMGGALINLRILRILRLQRVLVDYETFSKFELALGLNPSDTRPYQLQLARVVISIFTLLSVTAGLIYSAEHVQNPAITDYFTALYFSEITLTTVGFGDIAPVTTAGKWIVGGSILVGSAVIPFQAAALVEALLDRQDEQQNEKATTATTTTTTMGRDMVVVVNGAVGDDASNNSSDNNNNNNKVDNKNDVMLLARQQDNSNNDLSPPPPPPSSESDILSRMDRLERKVDDTNMRLDRVLTMLEEKARLEEKDLR